MQNKRQKPGRPLGVSIAVIASFVSYTLLPLLWVGIILLIESRFRTATSSANPFGGDVISGGDFRGGISNERIVIQVISALTFGFVAILAWRGKPARIRYIFIAAVLGLTAITLISNTIPTNGDGDISGGSFDFALQCVDAVYLFGATFLIPIYVVWYLNRGPARAFYRGYYLPTAAEQNPAAEELPV